MVYGKLITPEGSTIENIKDTMKDIVDIRYEVFGIREDENDINANEVLITDLDTNEYAAIGRIYMNEDYEFVIDLIGVLEKYRGLKYGDFVIRMLVDKAFSCGATRIYAKKYAKNIEVSTEFLSHYKFKDANDGYMVLDRKDFTTGCGHCHS